MAAVSINSFDSWLTKKLKDLNTDEGVFGLYIKGILEGDETNDEKVDALKDILAGILEDNIEQHIREIFSAWEVWPPPEDAAAVVEPLEDIDVRLARMLESQRLPTTKQRSYTEEELRIRKTIIAEYSPRSDDEYSEEEGDEEVTGDDYGIEKNTNAATIFQQEKEKRERAKQECQKKKEKDKEDRQKQKQLKEEKKEKRKTQKGERRR